MIDPALASVPKMTASWRTELQRRIRMFYQINLAYFEHAPAELIGFGYQLEKRSLWDLQRWYTKIADSEFALMRHAQVHSGLRRDTTRNCVDIRGGSPAVIEGPVRSADSLPRL